jgi:hypothetical protein
MDRVQERPFQAGTAILVRHNAGKRVTRLGQLPR